jgi:hypothetical protein
MPDISGLAIISRRCRTMNKEAEEKFPFPKDSPYYFGEEFPDGRLTADYDNTRIRFWDAIKRREELGRPFTEEEMKEFEYQPSSAASYD